MSYFVEATMDPGASTSGETFQTSTSILPIGKKKKNRTKPISFATKKRALKGGLVETIIVPLEKKKIWENEEQRSQKCFVKMKPLPRSSGFAGKITCKTLSGRQLPSNFKTQMNSIKVSLHFSMGIIVFEMKNNDIALSLTKIFKTYYMFETKTCPVDDGRLNDCVSCNSVAELIQQCDIVFICEKDAKFVQKVFYEEILPCSKPNLAVVIFCKVEKEELLPIYEEISANHGRLLEAQFFLCQSLLSPVMLCTSGDDSLFHCLKSSFKQLTENVFWLGKIGNVSNLNFLFGMLFTTNIVALSEVIYMANEMNVMNADIWRNVAVKILKMRGFCSPLYSTFGAAMLSEKKSSIHLTIKMADLKTILENGQLLCQEHEYSPFLLTATSKALNMDASGPSNLLQRCF